MPQANSWTSKILQFSLIVVVFFCLCRCAKPNWAHDVTDQPRIFEDSHVTPLTCRLQFSFSKLCVDWGWEVPPQPQVMATMIVRVFQIHSLDSSTELTNLNFTPQMTLEMPSMSFCSSPRVAEQIGVGTYRIKNIHFAMPGEWLLRLSTQSLTTVIDEAKIYWSAK